MSNKSKLLPNLLIKKLNIGSGKNKMEDAVNIDCEGTYSPDILCDATRLPFKDLSFNEIVCNAVLEHVKSPESLVEEIYRVLNINGVVTGWCPFLTGYHGTKKYGDYYRFTEDGILALFHKFSQVSYGVSKGYCETMLQLSPFPQRLNLFARQVDKYIKTKTVAGHHFEAIK